MSSQVTVSIHPSLPLIFPLQGASSAEKKSELDNLDADAAWRFYSNRIRRNPKDLSQHTHRVFFAMKHKNASLLAGSLHDLFYVLKDDAGENLRKRLLKASLPYLSKEDTLYFAMWIKTGTKKGIGYKWVEGSVLSDGLFGPNQNLVTMHKSSVDETKLAPLEEARSCMALGQLDVARKILEEALEADADDNILLEELAYLNQYVKSREIQPPKEKHMGILKKLNEKVLN